MQLDRPRFRQDLVAEPIDDSGTRFIDVMDPDSGNVFRFFEVEYSLACAMDGERDVPSIVQWAKEELGVAPSASEIRTVIATLGELGYLDKADGVAQVAAPAQDELLRPGVVVGQPPRAAAAALDVELGHAGPSTPVAAPKPTPAFDIELAPGVTAARPMRDAPKLAHDDIALGVPGRVDVSTDLSEQVGIDLEDVKEAVRASQVMKAVDVPPELAAVLSDDPPAKPPSRPTPTPRHTPPPMHAATPPEAKPAAKAEAKAQAAEPKPVAAPPVAARPVAAPVEAPKSTPAAARVEVPAPVSAKAAPVEAPAPKAAARAEAPAKVAEKPAAKAVAEKPAAKAAVATPVEAASKAPPAPAQTSRPLLVILVVVVLAAVAFLAYRYLMKSTTTAAVEPTKAHDHVVQPPQPVPPPVESEKLATIPESTEELKPAVAGQIESLAPDGEVKVGSVIATLSGAKPLQTEIASLSKDIDKRIKVELEQAQKDQDAATAAGNKSGIASAAARIADRQKSLADKQGKIAAKQAELDKLEIAATSDGKLTAKVKVGAHVTPNDTVFTLVRPAMRTATFALADGAAPAARVLLVAKADGKKLSCVVNAAAPNAIVITCPADAAPEGTEVTYGGVDSTPPPATDTIEMTDENGSAAAIASPAPVRPTTHRPTPKTAPKAAGSDATPPSAPTPDTTPPPAPPAAPAGSAAP